MRSRQLRWTMTSIAALGLMITASAAPAPADTSAPSSMAALGDSLSRGFNACGWMFDCTDRSWSTGDSEAINSHYSQILEVNPKIAGNNFNNARTGADSYALVSQATAAVEQGVDYVTILIGANDVCSISEEYNTATADFRANVDTALARLKAGLPEASVFVASVPDVVRVWEIAGHSSDAQAVWKVAAACPTVLGESGSVAADDQRRDRMRQRIDEYNAELAAACEAYGPLCVYDGGATNSYAFTMDQMSTWDYFHLNREGQNDLAEVTYAAGFGW
ncbi:MAG: SGNH/GDSL hydrolase family protein [Stackebrandtia sp.]